MHLVLHRVTTRLLRRVITSVLRNGVRVFTCVIALTRRARWVDQGVYQVNVVRTCPLRSKGVQGPLGGLKRRLLLVWVCSMVNRLLNCGLRFLCAPYGRVLRLIGCFLRQTQRVPSHGSKGDTVEAFAIAPFKCLRVNVVLKDNRYTLCIRLIVVNLSRVLRRLSPVRFAVRFVRLKGFGNRFLRVAFQGTARCVGLLRISFLLNLHGFRGRVGKFLLNIASRATDVSCDGLSLQSFHVVYRVRSRFLRLARRVFQVRRIFEASWDSSVCDLPFRTFSPGDRSAGSFLQGAYGSSVPSPGPVCLAKVLG